MSDDLTGKTLGQYHILEEIGRGGMATVYSARQSSINRVVAIKVLPRNLLHDPSFYDRFEREVDVIAKLEHPHILPIYDYGKDEGVPYIVMRYLKGGSMRDLIRRGLPTLEGIEKPFSQVAQALDHAHQQGIIHRDLKPGNVMLDENGNAYLTDFGIARVLGSDLTGSAIIGTPAYMSPEQANGLPLDARSDIYALGVVLFELITGREPYQAETPMALLLKHINEPMPPASLYRGEVPPAVEVVIAKATAKNPDDRYASASDMARAYRDAIQGGRPALVTPAADLPDNPTYIPTSGMTPRPMTAARQTGTQIPAAVTEAPAVPTKGRGVSPLVIGGAVVAVALLIGAAVLFIPRPTEPAVDLAATSAVEARFTPTPFPDSQRIEHARYSISIPRAWIPPQGFFDITRENTELIHVWQPSDMTSYVGLTLIDAGLTPDSDLAAVAQELDGARWETPSFTFLDESTAPNGTLRRSHRVIGPVDPPFPNGQTDTFYFASGSFLVILDMYSADTTGSTLVPTFQQILDSVRIKST